MVKDTKEIARILEYCIWEDIKFKDDENCEHEKKVNFIVTFDRHECVLKCGCWICEFIRILWKHAITLLFN